MIFTGLEKSGVKCITEVHQNGNMAFNFSKTRPNCNHKGTRSDFWETSEIKQYVILINAKIESTNVDFSGKGEKNIVDYLFT